jgi:hypothetical protein
MASNNTGFQFFFFVSSSLTANDAILSIIMF